VIDSGARDWPRQQAARIIRERITSGEYGPKLPPIEQLARDIGVAPKTIQKALAILKDEGLLIGQPGRGVFVR